MTPPHAEFTDDHTPLAYFITFRTYGSWLHGDVRGSVDRQHNVYGTPYLPPNKLREEYERCLLKQPPVRLRMKQRRKVEEAVYDTCKKRKWNLWVVNARTNHVHSVVTAGGDPEIVLNAFKANATRMMREAGLWKSKYSPWVKRGSKIWLWTQQELMAAIDYVLYDQGP